MFRGGGYLLRLLSSCELLGYPLSWVIYIMCALSLPS